MPIAVVAMGGDFAPQYAVEGAVFAASEDGAEVLLIEPSATVNTGDTPSELTAERRFV